MSVSFSLYKTLIYSVAHFLCVTLLSLSFLIAYLSGYMEFDQLPVVEFDGLFSLTFTSARLILS